MKIRRVTIQERYEQGIIVPDYQLSLLYALCKENFVIFDASRVQLNESVDDEIDPTQYKVGDIVFVPNNFKGASSSQGHKVLIVTSVVDNEDGFSYTGHPFLSDHPNNRKSNKHNPKYPNNLYIDNYSSVLKSRPYAVDYQAFIRVDELNEFTNADLSRKFNGKFRNYKGTVKPEFLRWVLDGARNYKSGNQEKNRNKFWQDS